MTEPTAAPTRKGDRIAKLLARAGVASRREIERMIDEGRVALDGTVLDTPATILTSLRGVTVDGHPVAAAEAARLFVYHKPTGLLVTERDPAGRATIYDRLPRDLPRTVPVGRLDLNTEGLLLLTTDGGLKRQLELPATGVERTYRARAYGNVTQAQLEELIEGVEIEGVRYGSIDANLERRTGANVWIELTLTEGKNREVRHVLEHLGLQVGRLIRTRYGPFILGDLPPGEVGEVKQHDLVAFSKTLAGPRRAKGADLQSLVEVETRKAKPMPAPAPVPAPRADERAVRAAVPAARPAAKPVTGWGSRTRPSRPGEPATQRAPFRTADDRARTPRDGDPRRERPTRIDGRDTKPVRTDDARDAKPARTDDRARNADPRAANQRPARPSRTASDPRAARATRDADERPRAADQSRGRPARSDASPRPARTTDDRPRAGSTRAGTLSSSKPGKGPAGGRGRPARPSDGAPRKGPPRGAPKGGPRGSR